MNAIIRIEQVNPDLDPGVQDVLKASRLMALDTTREDTISLAASMPESGVVGCAAVEKYGENGLLRSVAVLPDRRGQHLGEYLVTAAEAESVEAGIDALYLLTETAEAFFDRLGYDVVDRTDVPEAVLASDQFAKLCPSSAVAMRRRLTSED
ncbi:MAG: GNAT family N-acetyltransferase [Rhodothermales bacterium]|nr:GNAT family N-acetyltransferase [Rhodothermales bacterium]MBO6780973.1 GNAT family N-acetyltransferase [Rhodothermales bacterium]